MQKIVIDAREWSTTTGRYVRELTKHLETVDTDLSHRYFILLKPKDMNVWTPKSKRFKTIACPYKEFTFAEQLGLLVQLLRIGPDLVHFPMVQQPILYSGKVVTSMLDLTTLKFSNPTKNRWVHRLKKHVYRIVNYVAAHKSKAIITISEYVKEDVARSMRINSRKVSVVYPGGDPLKAKPVALSELENASFIMYVGRPSPHKNIGRLIEAFSQLKQTLPDLHLVLAGKSDALFRHHEHKVAQLGIPDIHFTGQLSDGQLRWLYEHTAAYVFPSLSEGFGLPGLEAMAHGAPVASSSATCLPEIYGNAAVYFDPLDVDDMANAIKQVLTKPTLRMQLIKAGRQQARKYSWRKTAEQTLDVYRYVLGE